MLFRTIALFLALSTFVFAKPNFTGEWKMNAAKSEWGPVPAPDKYIRTIKHDDPNMEIKTVQAGAQGEISTETKYTTDGKEFTTKTRVGEVKGTAKWDGDVLVVDSKRSIQGTEVTQTDRWSLEDSGKAMKLASKIQTPQGEFEVTIYLEKQ